LAQSTKNLTNQHDAHVEALSSHGFVSPSLHALVSTLPALLLSIAIGLSGCSGGKKTVTEGEGGSGEDPTPHVADQPTNTDDGPGAGGSAGGGATAPASYIPTLTAADSTVRSGESTLVTLTLKNAAGEPFAGTGLVVVFETAGGTSTGTLSATEKAGPGIFTSTFTGILAGTPVSITATVSGARVSAALPSIIVVPGAVAGETSTVAVEYNSVAAGSDIAVTITPRDAAGNAYINDDLVVALALSNGTSSGSFSLPVRQSDGRYLGTFSGETAGSPTDISASFNGTVVTSVPAAVTVTPGPVSILTSLVTSDSGIINSGTNTTITLQARDAFGNNLTSGGHVIAFTAGIGTSTGTISAVTDHLDGTYSAQFAGELVGTGRAIETTIDGNAVATAQPVITVIPGTASAAQSTISVDGGSVASGSTRIITLISKDSFGNDLTTGGLAVTFGSSGGTSTGSFSAVNDAGDGTYTATFTGIIAGSATSINATVSGNAVTTAEPQVTVTPGTLNLSQSVLTAADASIASGSSTTFTLTTKDAAGNQLDVGGHSVVFSVSGGVSTGSFSAVVDAGDGTYSSIFTGIIAGTATTASASVDGSSITSTLPTITVVPGPFSLIGSTTTASAATVAAGSDITLTLQTRDLAGNATATTGLTVVISISGGTSDGSIDTVNDLGGGVYTATFSGETAGTPVAVQATADGSPVTGTTGSFSVVPGPADMTNSIVTVSAPTVVSGNPVTVTLFAFDAFNNQLTDTDGGVVFDLGGGTSTGSFGATSAIGNGTYQAVMSGVVSGTVSTLSATYDGSSVLSAMPSLQVLTGPISSITSSISISAATIQSGNIVVLTLTAKDINGNLLTSGGASVGFSHFGGTSTGAIGSTLDGGTGIYTADFVATISGSATTINATIGGTPVTTTLPSITVIPGPPFTLDVSGHPGGTAGIAGTFTVRTKDLNGNTVEDYQGTITFTSTDPQAELPADYTYIGADLGTKQFSATLKTAGSMTLTATDTSNALVTGTQTDIVITPAAATKLYFGGAATSKARLCSDLIEVGLKDPFNNNSTSGSNTDITLAGAGSGVFYSDSSCSAPTSSITVVSGESFSPIYYKSILEGALVFSATDDGSVYTAATGNFEVKPWAAWVGSDAVISHFDTESYSARGREDGFFNAPVAVAMDDSNFMYVADSSNNRVHKFNRADDTYVGWIGKIGVSPTGGEAGCAGATVNTATPGWCTGGRSATSTLTGYGMFYAPQSIYYNGGYLYTVDVSNNRIQRTDAATGAPMGWIGRILTSPTGGDAGCAGAAVGSTTPGWCTGGTAQLGTGNGHFKTPRYIIGDGTFLYVSDTANHRLVKIDMAAGVFQGWFGVVATVPTGGAAGCTATAVSAVTPGWCLGGTAKYGTINGALYNPRGLLMLGTNLYVADSSNHRIQRYDLSAEPAVTATGWIGRILTKPTGGDAGCTAAAVGAFTPGWCTGGTARSGTANGNFNTPYRVTGDTSYLYVLDYSNQRIQRFGTTTPAFSGWAGRILTSPTGGDAGCAGAPINTATPGWCNGGTATWGFKPGMRYSAQGLELIDGALYVSDSSNHRVEKLDPATGTHLGSLGAKPQSGDTWSVTVADPHTGAYDDKSFINLSGIALAGGTMYVGDGSSHRIKKMSVSTGAFEGWMGAVATPATGGTGNCLSAAAGQFSAGWCTGGDTKTGTGNGMLNLPQGVFEYAGNLYVADSTNHRISRYTAATGVFTGWIGYISTSPTGGGAGCAGAAANTVTPGWCTGGTAKTGSVSGAMNTPSDITSDGSYLFVADKSNNRVNRYNLLTGVFSGWIGRISASPTGGDAGCAGAASGTFTPGWCTGGTAAAGTANGNLSAPKGLLFSGSSLYVADTTNNRISRYTAATGAFTGWMGRINTSPNGGDAGCSGAAANSFTPGWCIGGTAKSGTGDGHLYGPSGLWSNGTALYVADSTNNRIARYDLTNAAFTGWMGNISTAPTGGDDGCASAVPSTLTPGWCTGGTAKSGKGIGMLDAPQFVAGAGLYIYVTDINNARVMRFPQ